MAIGHPDHEAAHGSPAFQNAGSPVGDHTAHDVAGQLNDRIADLATELLGAPNKALSSKTELRYGNKGSIAITIQGGKIGVWYDHENGTGGDAIGLVREHLNFSYEEAFDWARHWLGLPEFRRK